MKKPFSLLLVIVCVLTLLTGCSVTDEEAISIVDKELTTMIYAEEDEKIEKLIKKYKNNNIQESVLENYVKAMYTECPKDDLGYLDKGIADFYLNSSFQINILEAMRNNLAFGLEKQYLDKLVQHYNKIDELRGKPVEIPSWLNEDELSKFAFTYVDGWAVQELTTFDNISLFEGYTAIVFTDYETSFWGEVPSYNEYYVVYLPEEYAVRESGVYYYDTVYSVKDIELEIGGFSRNVPCYVYPSDADYSAMNRFFSHHNEIDEEFYAVSEVVIDIAKKLGMAKSTDKASSIESRTVNELGVETEEYSWVDWDNVLGHDVGYVSIQEGVLENDSLPVKSSTNEDARTVGALKDGDKIAVVDAHDGWAQISSYETNDIRGFVNSDFIILEDGSLVMGCSLATITKPGVYIISGYEYEVIAVGKANANDVAVMYGADYSAQTAGVLSAGEKVYVLYDEYATDEDEGWVQIFSEENDCGFVESKYLNLE